MCIIVYHIDVKMFGFTGWCSAYLVAGDKKVALIDTGPATSIDAVRAGILKHGFALKDVTHILITHIHFDHFGSAGILLQEMPEARKKLGTLPNFNKFKGGGLIKRYLLIGKDILSGRQRN